MSKISSNKPFIECLFVRSRKVLPHCHGVHPVEKCFISHCETAAPVSVQGQEPFEGGIGVNENKALIAHPPYDVIRVLEVEDVGRVHVDALGPDFLLPGGFRVLQ